MAINLKPKSILLSLLCVILFLFLANMGGIISTCYFDHDYIYGLIPLFDFNVEKNIPTFYSFLTLLLSAIFLSIIAIENKVIGRDCLAWSGLAIVFLFLSIDEIASIHEKLIRPVRDTLGVTGSLYFAWIIPYAFGLTIFVILYIKFLINLPRRIMVLFIASGAVFVFGAIGFELLEGLELTAHGYTTITYRLLCTCEELLEMLGIGFFIYALTSYMNLMKQVDSSFAALK